jgi:phage terminase large subunit
MRELMRLQPKQQIALDTLLTPQCKYLLYGGAMAGGKSYLLRWAALYFLLWLSAKTNIPNIPIGLFSEDYPTLKDRQISRIVREFPPSIGELKESHEEGFAFFVHERYGGGRILLRNLDDPSKYMSSEFAGIFQEEATRSPEATFQDLRNRLRYPGVESVKYMGASNPGGVGHDWVKKFFVDKYNQDPEKDRFFYVHANAYDNKFISPDYIRQLESLPEQKRKAYLEGSWDVFAGQVFSEFVRAQHTTATTVPRAEFTTFLSFDWGYAAPFACYAHSLVDMKTVDGTVFKRLITWGEWYGIEKPPAEWARIIYEDLDKRRITLGVCDPSMLNRKGDGSRPIMDEMIDTWRTLSEGEWIVPIEGGSKDRLKRITLTHSWLSLAPDGIPYWLIADNCVNLIRTLPALVYDEHKLKKEDIDTTLEDHAWDSVSYLISTIHYEPRPVGATGSGFVEANIVEIVDEEGRGLMPFDIHAFERDV